MSKAEWYPKSVAPKTGVPFIALRLSLMTTQIVRFGEFDEDEEDQNGNYVEPKEAFFVLDFSEEADDFDLWTHCPVIELDQRINSAFSVVRNAP